MKVSLLTLLVIATGSLAFAEPAWPSTPLANSAPRPPSQADRELERLTQRRTAEQRARLHYSESIAAVRPSDAPLGAYENRVHLQENLAQQASVVEAQLATVGSRAGDLPARLEAQVEQAREEFQEANAALTTGEPADWEAVQRQALTSYVNLVVATEQARNRAASAAE